MDASLLASLGHGCNESSTDTRSILSVVGDNVPSQSAMFHGSNQTYFPLSPKISTKAVWMRLAKLGYFCSIRVASYDATSTHVVQRAISTNGASLVEVALLADEGGDATSAKTSGTGADESGKLLEELTLFNGSLDTEEVSEDTNNGQELVGSVAIISNALSCNSPLHQGQEGSVKVEGLLELVSVLTQEEISLVDELADDETEDFAEVKTGNHLLKRLLSWLVGGLVDDNVVLGAG